MNWKLLLKKIVVGFLKGAAGAAAGAYMANPDAFTSDPAALGPIAIQGGLVFAFGEGGNNFRKHIGKPVEVQ